MSYEKYPWHQVFITNTLSILIYTLGVVILQHVNWVVAGLYLIYIFILEIRLLKYHCPNCYYYGKICAFGKGRISSIFFKKGNPDKFICKSFSVKDLIPDILVFAFPAFAGIILLITDFQWYILVSLAGLIILNFSGNALVRGQIACKNCRQKDLGCPALDFFKPADK
jgi:hypothetical protein